MAEENFEYNEAELNINPMAKPIADARYEHKTFQLISRQKDTKKALLRGVKEVKKGIRKGITGLVVIAADVQPFDVISFLPAKCESKQLPYYFVKSQRVLSKACGTKQTATAVMVKVPEGEEDKKQYGKLVEKAGELAKQVDTFLVY